MVDKVKNPRAFSLEESFMNYKVNDLIYGFMRGLSTVRPPVEGQEHREYLIKKNFSKNKKLIANVCDISARRVGQIVDELFDKGLLDEGIEVINGKDVPCYWFPKVEGKYEIVEQDMVKFLVNTVRSHSIKIYIYLLNKFKWKRQTDEYYIFTLKELSSVLGYAESTRTAEPIIKDVLHIFKLAKLIDYDVIPVEVEHSDFAGSRTFKMRLNNVCERVSDLDASGFENYFI